MAGLDKKSRDNGLALIGMHVQSGTNEEIKALLDKNKAKFTVVDGGKIPENGSGIPFSIVLDGTGKLIYKGHPADKEFEKAIRKGLQGVKAAAKAAAVATSPSNSPAKNLFEEREWANQSGKKIVAAVVSATKDKVTFKIAGKLVPYQMSLLREEDQKTILAAIETETK